jgi:hypothetical protein
VCRLPHAKAITGQIIFYIESFNRATKCVQTARGPVLGGVMPLRTPLLAKRAARPKGAGRRSGAVNMGSHKVYVSSSPPPPRLSPPPPCLLPAARVALCIRFRCGLPLWFLGIKQVCARMGSLGRAGGSGLPGAALIAIAEIVSLGIKAVMAALVGRREGAPVYAV